MLWRTGSSPYAGSSPDRTRRCGWSPRRAGGARQTQRSRATLAMLGHHVDGVVINGAAVGEHWPPRGRGPAPDALVAARDRFSDLPVRVAAHCDLEPVGVDSLLALADGVLAGADPLDLGAPRGVRTSPTTATPGSSTSPSREPRSTTSGCRSPTTATSSSTSGRIVASSPCRPCCAVATSPAPRST